MELPKTQQECLLFSWKIFFKENKGLILLSLSSLSGKDAPQSMVNIPLKWVITKTKGYFQQDGGYSNSKVGLESNMTQVGVENSVWD